MERSTETTRNGNAHLNVGALRALLVRNGLGEASERRVAAWLGVPQPTLNRWLSDENDPPQATPKLTAAIIRRKGRESLDRYFIILPVKDAA